MTIQIKEFQHFVHAFGSYSTTNFKVKSLNCKTMVANCNNMSNNSFQLNAKGENGETINETTFIEEIEDKKVTGKQNRISNQLNLNLNCNKTDRMPAKSTCDNKNHDKSSKVKQKKNRELGELEENHILEARVRSNSGKLYSTSVSVDPGAITSTPASSTSNLSTLLEEEEDTDNTDKDSNMCVDGECCKGTSKLVKMIAKLQKSVDGVLKKDSTQEIVESNTSHRILDLQDDVKKNTDEIDDLGKELEETKFQLKVVSKIVVKQDQQIAFLKEKINDIQQREMAANVVISGIPESRQEHPIKLFNTNWNFKSLFPQIKLFELAMVLTDPSWWS